jgi:alkaline phosphatase
MTQTRIVVLTICLLAISCLGTAWAGNGNGNGNGGGKYKNVIVLVPDGCDQTVQTLARWYKGAPLHSDGILAGHVSTYMTNSVITGSAAAATAFATGEKTTVRFLSVGPRTDNLLTNVDPDELAPPYTPIATVLEGARSRGKATGLVSTSRITHATPAAYGCHIHDRGLDNEIMEHLVYQNIDVVFGGGFRHLIPEGSSYTTSFGDTWWGKRTDGDDLYQVLMDRGYQFVDSQEQLIELESGRVWGMFDDSHMEADIDRAFWAPHQPSIAELTEKAIKLLSQDNNGFFLMVEGSEVDWAGHANDPVYMVTDFLAYDEAVGVALDFARQNKQTLVIAFPDHNTGAMSIGNASTDWSYTSVTIEDLIDPLMGMAISSTGCERLINDLGGPTIGNIQSVISDYWSINLSSGEAQEIIDMHNGGLYLSYAISNVVSAYYTRIGWTTYGHVGADVPLWAWSANKLDIAGLYDNTELAGLTAQAMGVNIEQLNQDLFVEVGDQFDNWYVDWSDAENPVLVVEHGDHVALLPCSTDTMYMDDTFYQLDGLVVYAPERDGSGEPIADRVYIPKSAEHMIL